MPKVNWLTGVYCFRCKVTNKRYVGSAAKSLKGREKDHRYALNKRTHWNRYFQAAWNKYGADQFEFIVLERCRPEECIAREQFWMDHFKSWDRNFGYNINKRADSPLGNKHSKETKARMSQAHKEQWADTEHREKTVVNLRKALRKPEYRKKRADIQRKIWEDDDFRDRLAKVQKKRYEDPAERTRTSEAVKKSNTPEVLQHRAKATKEALNRPETRKKHLDAIQRLRNDPEIQKKRIEALRKKLATPEMRVKRREAALKWRAKQRAEKANKPGKLVQGSLFGFE